MISVFTPSRESAAPLIVGIGLLVGGNFALGKHVVMAGLSPLVLFEWQVLGAGLALILGLAVTVRSDFSVLTARPVLIYCTVNGLTGVSAPQILGYFALQQIPAGLFTMLVTLSPLLTFCLSSLVSRRLLPVRRLLGLLVGLAGVTIAAADGVGATDVGPAWIAAACLVPVLLAVTNVYRERAMPRGANPLVLAAGTLLTQAFLFMPAAILLSAGAPPPGGTAETGVAVLVLCGVTALGYLLTFELYRRTDGVGFSQVGYFVTLSGIAAGALFFDEAVSPWFAFSVILLFLGMALARSSSPSAHQPQTQTRKET